MARSPWRRLASLRSPYLIVVPLLDEATGHALDIACRLGFERRSSVLLIAPLFVELELPLDAQFPQEEADLREELNRKRTITESYGVRSEGRIIRTRHGQLGLDLAAAAIEAAAALIVLGAAIESRPGFHRPFSRDVWSVIHDAPCPVLIASDPTTCARAA